MSPWLFNVFMDGVMKEVRERVGDSKEKLERLVQEFNSVCLRWKFTVNEGKSKV